jgi:hypothetical protein
MQVRAQITDRRFCLRIDKTGKAFQAIRSHYIFKQPQIRRHIFHGKTKNSVALVHKLYRPSDRRLLGKLVPTFADRGCRVGSATDPHGRILGFLDRRRYYFFQVAPQLH